ncbi:MAG: hypothetical protein ACI9FN_001062 [Saprospiraceae bacterium]|jgi:hypothetical protein
MKKNQTCARTHKRNNASALTERNCCDINPNTSLWFQILNVMDHYIEKSQKCNIKSGQDKFSWRKNQLYKLAQL